jgi:hypothetical protein
LTLLYDYCRLRLTPYSDSPQAHFLRG